MWRREQKLVKRHADRCEDQGKLAPIIMELMPLPTHVHISQRNFQHI